MKDDDQRRTFGWALPASLAVHLLAGALLIFGLPVSLFEAEPEKAVNVDLVPPPEQPKQAKAETAPKPEEKAEPKPEPKPETKAEPKPETEKEAAQRPAENVLQPVHRFGETDAGPKLAPDGNSAREASPQDADKPQPQEPEVAKAEPAEPEQPAPQTAEPPDAKAAAQPQALTAARATDVAPLPEEAPAPKPAPSAAEKKAAKAEQAKKLASRMDTGAVLATTAMADLPRSVRAGRLCVTELRERMREASPPYFPDLLPSYPLERGNVLEIPKAAFRLNGAWYDLSFRCEIDTNATEVLAFVFRVGAPIPPNQWKSRGLPAR